MYTCQCDWKHFYGNDTNLCEERPELGDEELSLFKFNPYTSNIMVQWKNTYTASDGRTHIIIYYSDKANIHQVDDISNDMRATVVSQLSSGTRYHFQLFSSRNSILSGENLTAETYTFPESPTSGGFEHINERNMTIYWTNDKNRNCENYSIEIDPTPEAPVNAKFIVERLNNTSNQSYTFQGLTGGTNYIVQIVSLVDTNKKKIVPLTRESYTRPEVISKIREIGKHSNSIDLSLTGPETFKEGYIVIVRETGAKHNFSTALNQLNVPIMDLEQGTNYTFNVFSFIKHLTSEHSVTWVTMTRPESPKNMEAIENTEDSITFKWTLKDNSTFDNFVIMWGTDGSDLLMPETRKHSIPNLEYGTYYNITIQTVRLNVRSEETKTTSYTSPIPPSIAKVTDQTDITISLYINTTEARYDHIVVFFGEMNETFSITSDVILTELEQGTNYTFKVHSMIGDVISLRSFRINGTTSPGSPKRANFPLESLHEKELTVNWEPVTIGGIDIYQIALTGGYGNQIQYKDVTLLNTSVTFTKLEAGHWYTATISTLWNRPPAPAVSTIDSITTTSMNIDIPETEWEYYFVVVAPSPNSGNSTYNISKDNLPLSLTGLDKGKLYQISVFSIVGGIQGQSSYNVSSYTKPDKVDSTTIKQNIAARSVMGVTWDFTEDQGGIDFYSLLFKCSSPNYDEPNHIKIYQNITKVTSAVVENLKPGTFCSITITTHIGNQTGESVTKDIAQSTNEGAADNVIISKFTTNAKNLSISWNKPLQPNGLIRRYYVNVIDVKHNCVKQNIEFKCANCKDITPNNNCSGLQETHAKCEGRVIYSIEYQKENMSYTYTTMENDLHPYRNYNVTITPYTQCFGATISRTKITKQSVPSGPPINITQSLSESTHDTLKLSWIRPIEDEQNGIITSYTVYYSYINRTCFDGQGNETMTSLNVKENASIKVAYAFWSYNVSVSAWTKVGEGPKSSSTLMRTATTTPGEIRNNPLANDPTTSTLNLSWEPPCYANGIIDHYRILVINVDSSTVVQNITTNSNRTDIIIKELLPYHNYTMSVAAVNTIAQEGHAVNTTAIARTKAEECEDGTYGLSCQYKCGNCYNNAPCNKIDGGCTSCAAGYKGSTCIDECLAGTYGFICKQRCGMCRDEDVCDIYTGQCPNGCADKYTGSQCSQEIHQDTSTSSDTSISLPVFIGSISAIVVVFTTIALVWFLYRKRLHKKTHKAANNANTSIQLQNTPSNYDTLKFDTPDEETIYTELNRI